ncbi:MAG: sugar porter family MFS transporter [Bacteroidota bacterium]
MSELQPRFNTRYVLMITFISAMGGYLFGFDFAVISGALPFLKTEFGLDEYWEGFTTASLALGCIVGCLVASEFSRLKGRKPALMAAAMIFLVSSVSMAFAPSLGWFICARFFAGVGVGMASMLSPMYIAEIAPANLRGRMVAVNQLTIVSGILITTIVNYYLSKTGLDSWRWMFGLGAAPSFLFVLGVIILPESPRWLVANGFPGKAEQVLTKIGGKEYAQSTVNDIVQSFGRSSSISLRTVFQKAFLPSVFIGIGLAVFQQFCGINVVFNFTTTIFQSIGFSQDDQLKQTMLIGIINLVVTLLAMSQVDKIGRKALMLMGAAGLAVLYVISAILLKMNSPLAAYSLLGAIGIYGLSLAPVTWVLISEIFPNKIRSAATTIAVVSLWLAYGILVFTFPIFSRMVGVYALFYVYAAVCLLGFVFVWFKVKETKGKSLEEMDDIFIGH